MTMAKKKSRQWSCKQSPALQPLLPTLQDAGHSSHSHSYSEGGQSNSHRRRHQACIFRKCIKKICDSSQGVLLSNTHLCLICSLLVSKIPRYLSHRLQSWGGHFFISANAISVGSQLVFEYRFFVFILQR